MAAPIDPPRTPLAPVSRVLAEAALQRQAMLQDAMAGKTGAAAAGPRAVPAPTVPGAPPAPTAAQAAAPPPLEADQLNLSAQARASLPPQPEQRQASAPTLPRGLAGTAPTPASPVPVAAAPWPASGLTAPLRQMLAELLRHIPLPGDKPAQLLAAHPWPAAMARQLLAGDGVSAPGLPALRTWLVAQGQAETPQGARAFTLTLRLPLAWLQNAGAQPAAARPLQAGFAGPPQALETGLYALALQTGSAPAARTSALLELAFAPQTTPPVYGRELLLPRTADPWLQLAALQASGHWREQALADEEPAERAPCREPGCPYEGRAPCVQPFCLALRVPGSSG